MCASLPSLIKGSKLQPGFGRMGGGAPVLKKMLFESFESFLNNSRTYRNGVWPSGKAVGFGPVTLPWHLLVKIFREKYDSMWLSLKRENGILYLLNSRNPVIVVSF
jgi:hypothetical protein